MKNRPLTDSEMLSYDVYFASVTSMQFHPGAGTKEHQRLSLEECSKMALDMIKLRREAMASGGF